MVIPALKAMLASGTEHEYGDQNAMAALRVICAASEGRDAAVAAGVPAAVTVAMATCAPTTRCTAAYLLCNMCVPCAACMRLAVHCSACARRCDNVSHVCAAAAARLGVRTAQCFAGCALVCEHVQLRGVYRTGHACRCLRWFAPWPSLRS